MKKKKNKRLLNNVIIGMSEKEINQIYGEATSQMIQAYKGIRVNKFGDEIVHRGRNLKNISNYKLNPEYREQNIKQQSGFSAELIEEARENKEAILSNNRIRVRTTDGIGRINDTQYDHIKIDENGDIIENTGTQMKFLKVSVMKNGEIKYDVIDKLANNKNWNRYDTKVTIPKEQYEGAVKYANSEYEKNIKLYKKSLENGKLDIANKYKQRAEEYKCARERIIPSNLTEKEALEARTNPEKFVAKEILKDIHEAGKVAAKGGMIVGGTIALAQNLYAVVNNEKDLGEAIEEVALSTLKSGTMAYTVGSTGSCIKSIMHSSENKLIRRLGTTSAPTLIVLGTIEIGKSIKKYSYGEINEIELLEELGEKGVGMLTAGYCASAGTVIGTTFFPVVGSAMSGIIGGVVGSILGYNISSILYKEALESLKAEKISFEKRKIIEKLAEQAIKENLKYKELFIKFSEEKLFNRQENIKKGLLKINNSILNNDIESYINAINSVGEIFGYNLQFKNFKEINTFMLDKNAELEL